MKKILLFLFTAILYGCGCIAQIPPQYVYVDSNCVGILPDYKYLVVAVDNCEIASLTQIPAPGVEIDQSTIVEMVAYDVAGNFSSVVFDVVMLDTLAPTIMLNPDWQGYTEQEIMDMYRTFYGHTQIKFADYNAKYAGDTQIFVIDSMEVIWVVDTVKIFQNTIPIPDDITDIDWWWANTD
jgi:hypothetical protein